MPKSPEEGRFQSWLTIIIKDCETIEYIYILFYIFHTYTIYIYMTQGSQNPCKFPSDKSPQEHLLF